MDGKSTTLTPNEDGGEAPDEGAGEETPDEGAGEETPDEGGEESAPDEGEGGEGGEEEAAEGWKYFLD
jgi:phosphate transport system substrate-binding protein